MKVVLTGGGTGGHFYPLIAVSEKLNEMIMKESLAESELYYLADSPYDKEALYENNIKYKYVPAGKVRAYASVQNLTDIPKTFMGIIRAIFVLFSIYPDVIFSKGGYAAFPTVVAAKLLRIPVIVHESDSKPGRVNIWTGKFASSVAVSYKQASAYFKRDKVIHTGQPIREILKKVSPEGGHEYLQLEEGIPIIWILGGSQGADHINYVIDSLLPRLTKRYQIIHQVGAKNMEAMKKMTGATLMDSKYKYRYRMFDFLNPLAMKMSAGVSDIVITRAGSTLFELANWQIPSIVIPLPNSARNHQLENAFDYAREGGCIVMEENNLSESLLLAEIDRIVGDEKIIAEMKAGAKRFAIQEADKNIAEEIVRIALEHEA